MFKEIFSFELSNGLRRPSIYLFFGMLLLMFGGIAAASVGLFDTTQSDSLVTINSAYAVTHVMIVSNSNIFGLINSILLVTIMGTAIQKDYRYNMHPLLFTTPISKAGYFFGRYLAAATLAIIVFSAIAIGYWIGCMLGYGSPSLGEFKLMNFVQPFLIFVLPNILLQGIIIFSLTTFLRNTLPAYLFAIIVLILQMLSKKMLADLDNKFMAALLDPMGSIAFSQVTEYWSPAEQNERAIPLTGVILYNRLLWIGVAALITFVSYAGFRFNQFLTPFRLFSRKESTSSVLVANALNYTVKPSFTFSARLKQFYYLTSFEWKKIMRTPFFIIMCALGLAFVFISSLFMDSMYDVITYPVTYKILDIVMGSFALFIIIFLVFYSGTLVWRDREQRSDELIGTTPVSNAYLFFSKYFALIGSVIVLLLVACFTGMLIQASNGFFDFDLKQYLAALMEATVKYAIIALVCMAVQTIVSNKFIGFFISLIPVLILNIVFFFLEWNNPLYLFNSSGPALPYSDMNGYNGRFLGFAVYKVYWLSISLFLSILGLMVFARGKERGIKPRYLMNRYAGRGGRTLGLVCCILAAAGTGLLIYRENNIVKEHLTPKEMEQLSVQYEKEYKKYEQMAQPRITAANVDVALYPKEHRMKAMADFVLKNKSGSPIDTLYINYNGGEKSNFHYTMLEPAGAHEVIKDDPEFGVKLIRLKTPLSPGDSIVFKMKMEYKPRGIFNADESSIVDNGTFINNSYFISIGYSDNSELSSNTARKKYGLKEKERMPSINDSIARMDNYISNDADWIRFETTVSTDEDQIAIAPGYLQKEWASNGRKYYHYKMDSPILNFYSYLSARYQVLHDKWNDVNIEIYYQKGHEYNLSRMVKSVKASLEYYTQNFGPYQHRQVRIIEFPRYASFAQAFPNTIPYSESIGFIAKVEEGEDKIDVPFYITAHEVAHQWWAHQVIGGNVQGSVLMSESMSQYSALMVMEKTYGKTAMKKFLEYELNEYLRGRTFENKKELPIMLVENQSYIHYAKGSLVMYALRDYLGEDVLNTALRAYLERTRYQGPPYTTALEFVEEIRAYTPDSLQYLVTDLFERITLYENYVKDLKYEPLEDGRYKVTLTVGCAKYYADDQGKDKRADKINDYVDIGIFSKDGVSGMDKELLLVKVKMDKQEKTFEYIVNEKPVKAGIDPYLKLIDRTPKNNTAIFGSQPRIPNLKEDKDIGIQANI